MVSHDISLPGDYLVHYLIVPIGQDAYWTASTPIQSLIKTPTQIHHNYGHLRFGSLI